MDLGHSLVVEVVLRMVVVEVVRNSFVVDILEAGVVELVRIFLAPETLVPLDILRRPQKELLEVLD